MSSAERTVHVIRFAGPWRYQALVECRRDAAGELVCTPAAAQGAVQMPCDWGASLGAEFRGRVRYERTFHWTAPRADGEELWLVFAGVDAAAQVVLNGEPLGRVEGRSTPYRFEIASRLAAQNRLIVEIECLPQLTAAEERRLRGDRAGLPGGLFGEVRLEITQQGPGSTS